MGFLLTLLAGLGAGQAASAAGISSPSDFFALGPGLPFVDVLGRDKDKKSRRRRRKMLTAGDIQVIATLAGIVGSGIAGKAALVAIARR